MADSATAEEGAVETADDVVTTAHRAGYQEGARDILRYLEGIAETADQRLMVERLSILVEQLGGTGRITT